MVLLKKLSKTKITKISISTRKKMEDIYGSPSGECYRWSMNLASELLEAGASLVTVVTGDIFVGKNILASHSWLQCSGFLIDISADQFNDLGSIVFSPVIVVLENRSKFHLEVKTIKITPKWHLRHSR
jgi:hypothetical protein